MSNNSIITSLAWIKKGWEASKLENRISPSVSFNLGKYAIGNAFAEGTEETTEELSRLDLPAGVDIEVKL